MIYKHSNALINYEARRKEIIELLKTIKPPLITVNSVHLIAPVIRASIVLLYSHIEGYIEDIVQETIEYLNNSGINVNVLPISIRIAHCMPNVKEITGISDQQRLDDSLKDMMKKNYSLWFGSTLPPAKIETDCLTKNFSNPSVDHVDKLFKQIGIQKVFGGLYHLGFKPQRIQPIKSTLENLTSLRHDIAHGNFSTVCSYTDFCRYLAAINTFCEAIDARLGKYIEELTGTFPWTI